MTIVACCILVPDAKKADVEEAIPILTPTYGIIGFIRKVCPTSPTPTWETSPTHWRSHDEVNQDFASLWQTVAIDGVIPGGWVMPEESTMTELEIVAAMAGTRVYTGGPDVGDTNAWAAGHMAPLLLIDVPPPPE